MSKTEDAEKIFRDHCTAQAQRLAVFEGRGWPYLSAGQAELSKRLETIAGTDRRKLSTRATDRVTAVIDAAVDLPKCPTPAELSNLYRDLFGEPENGKLGAGCPKCAPMNGDWCLTETGVRRCACERGQRLRDLDRERAGKIDTRNRPELQTARQMGKVMA